MTDVEPEPKSKPLFCVKTIAALIVVVLILAIIFLRKPKTKSKKWSMKDEFKKLEARQADLLVN